MKPDAIDFMKWRMGEFLVDLDDCRLNANIVTDDDVVAWPGDDRAHTVSSLTSARPEPGAHTRRCRRQS